MRKVILNLAVSLDGYMDGPQGEYDWCFNDQDYGMSEFLGSVDAIFMGRKTYEFVAGLEEQTFPGIHIYVFSDTMTTTLDNPNVTLISSENFAEQVADIVAQPGGNIWLFGGAGLIDAFTEKKLINEYRLSVHPVVLGGGHPLFPQGKSRLSLSLTGSKVYPNGLVQLQYLPLPEFDYSILNDTFTRTEGETGLSF